MMKQKISQIVFAFLENNPRRMYKTKELARLLQLPKQGEEYMLLKQALRELQEEGKVERIESRKWAVKRTAVFLEGELKVTKKGYGIVTVVTEPGREIFIPRGFLHFAIDGDKVRVRLFSRSEGVREEGEVVEILSRQKAAIVGSLKNIRGQFYVEPDTRDIQRDILIPKRELHGARDGDKVVVEILRKIGDEMGAQGSIAEVLGQEGDTEVELVALARRYGLSLEFPDDVENEAHAIPSKIPQSDYEERLDLRDQIIFTIDPEDARDFDDAVSLSLDDDGNYLLGVHIADVSHYVLHDSKMDREALARGTSVYLVNGVIPMLPERLSNHLCSLKEGKDRLTVTVWMTVSPRGAMKKYSFTKSVIRSRRRFSYTEVEEIIKREEGDFVDEILLMNKLANILMRKRFREGSIDFDVPEVKFILSPSGYPLEIVAKERLQSMRLIEEFMLLANKTVATAVRDMSGRDAVLPFLYRVHDLPDPEKISDLLAFIHHLGINITLDPKSSKSFQKMIETIKDKPEGPVVQDVTIRSLAKAAYSEKNIGHFGLGFQLYTHFTSPIRRYPDLVVHRLLWDYLDSQDLNTRGYYAKRLPDIAQQSSARERLAIEAERESIKIKEIEYMQRHLGDEFDAVISGATPFGLFVEIYPTMVEGLVHIRSLDDDYYMFDKNKRALIGQRKRKKYALGDKVRVQVIRVDMIEKEIDFTILQQ